MLKWSIENPQRENEPPMEEGDDKHRLVESLFNSSNCKCKVASINPTTGEYRIIIQGTLDPTELAESKT